MEMKWYGAVRRARATQVPLRSRRAHVKRTRELTLEAVQPVREKVSRAYGIRHSQGAI